MIVIDTHIWIWWTHGDERLTRRQAERIKATESDIVGVSAISCWEIAKLVEYRRLEMPFPLDEWFQQALSYPGIRLLELTPEIAIASTRLPGEFHRDPADQIIVATARHMNLTLLTKDREILDYSERGYVKAETL